jgi:hypothetical protein
MHLNHRLGCAVAAQSPPKNETELKPSIFQRLEMAGGGRARTYDNPPRAPLVQVRILTPTDIPPKIWFKTHPIRGAFALQKVHVRF